MKNKTISVFIPIVLPLIFLWLIDIEQEVYLITTIFIGCILFFYKNYFLLENIKSNDFNKHYYPLLLLIIFVLNFIFQNKLLNYETITWDVPSYLVASQEIGKGFLPLETQWESKGPLLFYIYFFISEIVNNNYLYFRLFNDLILFCSILLIFKIVEENRGKKNAFLSAMIFTLITSFEWFVSEFSEIYCLLFLGIINFLHIRMKMSIKKYFVIGILFSVSTLINQGTVLFIIPYLILIILNHKQKRILNNLFYTAIGFLIPHGLFIYAYLQRGIFDIYFSNYFTIPLLYTESNASSFYELKVVLRRLFQYDYFLYFLIIGVFVFAVSEIILKLKRKKYEFIYDIEYLNLIFALSFYFIAGHNYAHHLFYFIFYFSIFSSRFKFNQLRLLTTLTFISTVSIFNFTFYDSINNLSNPERTYDNYPLRTLSLQISQSFEEDFEVLALDYVLVLYYLNKPNYSYIVHPGNHFEEFIVTELKDLKRIKSNEFSHISYYIEKEPDVILCNPTAIISGKAQKLDFYNCSIDDYKKNYFKLDTESIKKNKNLDLYKNPYESINVYLKNSE